MKFRTTLILAIALLGVSVLFFVATRDTPPPGSPEGGAAAANDPNGRKLFDVKADELDHFTIRPAEGTPLDLTKSEGQWKVVSPVNWPADSGQVSELLSSIVNLHSHGSLDLSDANATSTGLDHPRFTIEASGGKNAIKLAVGSRSALGNDLYVKAGDAKQADLVPAGTLGSKLGASKAMDKLVDSVRSKKLLTIANAQVQQIQVDHHGAPVVVHHLRGGMTDQWAVVAPAQIPADTAEVNSLLDSVTGLEASEFSTEAAAQDAGAQFDHPRVTVWLSGDAPPPPTTAPAAAKPAAASMAGTTIVIGQSVDIQAEKTWVKVTSPQGSSVVAQAAFSKVSFDNLKSSSPLTLRDKNVLSIDPSKISSFTIAINKPATTQPTTQPAEQREFTIAHRKAPVLGPTLPTTQPTGLAKPASPAADELAVAKSDDGSLAASSCPGPSPTTRPADSATAATQPTTHRTGEVASTPTTHPATEAAAATTQPTTQPAVATTQPATQPGVATTQPTRHPAMAASTAPGSPWIFTSGGTGDAEEGQVKDLLDTLHPLHVVKYIEADPSAKGATYTLTIHAIPLKASDNDAHFVLTFIDTGTRIVGSYRDLHFEVDRTFLEKLNGDFKTKKAPPPPASPPPNFHGQGGGGLPFGIGGQ